MNCPRPISFALFLLAACSHRSPPPPAVDVVKIEQPMYSGSIRPSAQVAPLPKPPRGILHIGHDPVIRPIGERVGFLFSDGSVFIQVSDGRGGPAIQYRGEPLRPEQVKSIRVLNDVEVRDRFSNTGVVSGLFIELK